MLGHRRRRPFDRLPAVGVLGDRHQTEMPVGQRIVAAKTRNALLCRPSPRAVQCSLRTAEILSKAAEAAGMPPGGLQVIPDMPREVTHHLFHHPDVDLIWTTGGPKIVELSNRAGKPVLSVGPGNAPVYLHRTADLRSAVVDILISKTFDASVICPAEQTCVIDDAIYAAAVEEAPDIFPLRFNYGGALRRLGRDAEAIVQLREAERLAPTDFDTQVELGLASMAVGDRQQALVHLRTAVEMHPDRPESVMHLPEMIRQLEASE